MDEAAPSPASDAATTTQTPVTPVAETTAPASQPDANQQSQETTATPAPSSEPGKSDTNQDAKKSPQELMLEHVRGVLGQAAAKPDPSPGGKDVEVKPAPEAKPAEAKVSDADLPFHNHPRFRELTQEHGAFKAELEQVRPLAQQYSQIVDFMAVNKLTVEDVVTGFNVMAGLKRGDPRALREIETARDRLLEISGEKLPPDLNDKLEQGLIDADTAKELARLRIGHDAATRTLGETEEERRSANMRALATEMQGAVGSWERDETTRNPDYPKIMPMVRDRAQTIYNARVAAGRGPTTPAEAVEIVRAAYNEIHGHMLKSFGVKRDPVNTRSPTSRPAATFAQPQPKTPLEAAEQALAQTRQ